MLNTPKNHKLINNEKGKKIRETENHIDIMVKNDDSNTIEDNILNSLHKNIENKINWKIESSLEKIQLIYNDELQVLRKELESKNKIIKKLLEAIENISNKAAQSKPLPILQLHLEDASNDTNQYE